MGVSAGLLSKIKGGKDTSPTMAALLMLLANAPARVGELEFLWKRTRDELQVQPVVHPPAAPPRMEMYPSSASEVQARINVTTASEPVEDWDSLKAA